MPKGDRFTPGDLVFAKVKGYPPWPARITGLHGKDRYKIYFYGTYETATLKNEDIWVYTQDNKNKFAPKNLKKKGYMEGLEQLENNPEIAAVDDDALANMDISLNTSQDAITPKPAKKAPVAPSSLNNKQPANTQKAAGDKSISKPGGKSTPTPAANGSLARRSNRDTAAETEPETPAVVVGRSGQEKRKLDTDATPVGNKPAGANTSERQSRGGRATKPKRFKAGEHEDGTSPQLPASENGSGDSKNRRISSKVNGDKKTDVGVLPSGDSSDVKSSVPDSRSQPALDSEAEKAKRLERRKNKLRWLKVEQRLVELDIAIKSSLHLEGPSPDRCISALEELNELALAPFMLKKQPDIVTTVRRLRKYIGPQSFNSWPQNETKVKMQRSIEIIQLKADQIYNKFKSYFAFQGEKPFSEIFEAEVEAFKRITKGMDETKVLSLTRDPTKPKTGDGLSEDDDI